jgi:hypothetical protein
VERLRPDLKTVLPLAAPSPLKNQLVTGKVVTHNKQVTLLPELLRLSMIQVPYYSENWVSGYIAILVRLPYKLDPSKNLYLLINIVNKHDKKKLPAVRRTLLPF